MAKVTFSSKGRHSRKKVSREGEGTVRSPEEVVREIKKDMRKPPGEDYRERSLAIHGLVCAYCGREFDHTTRHLLTVHHKDGNHHNNPRDGSNWENLCVYCHENIHSRELFGDYLDSARGETGGVSRSSDERRTEGETTGFGLLGQKLQTALRKKKRKIDEK